jgi:hypothetical protein
MYAVQLACHGVPGIGRERVSHSSWRKMNRWAICRHMCRLYSTVAKLLARPLAEFFSLVVQALV